MNPVLIIPARLGSTRLHQKALHIIHVKPLICHVVEQAKNYFKGRIVLATCDERIANLVHNYNVETVITDPELASGSDRVHAAFLKIVGDHDVIINLQGDMVLFQEDLITKTLKVFDIMPELDVATAISPVSYKDAAPQSTVKVAYEPHATHAGFGEIFYFSRSIIPSNAQQLHKHIGIYAYKKQALQDFVNTPPALLEKSENLEQLRGLSLGHRFGAAVVEGESYCIDTIEDVQMVEKILASN